jgi:3-oxoacyl-[acyl-carrier protein] reductase
MKASEARADELLNLSGKVALVTGAGQGVGRGIALMLAAHGASVVVNDYVKERADAVAKEITDAGLEAIASQGDVTDFKGVLQMVDEARKQIGAIDILVNNAGNAGSKMGLEDSQPFWNTDPEEWQNWFGTNLFGVMHMVRAVMPSMIERKWGRLITITSDAGRVGEPHLATYSAAKAGAAGFMRAMAKAGGRYGITSNCIALGGVDTPGAKGVLHNEEAIQRMLKHYIIRRVGRPSDAAVMTLVMASEAGSWITGQTYPVNGGYSFAF